MQEGTPLAQLSKETPFKKKKKFCISDLTSGEVRKRWKKIHENEIFMNKEV